MERGARIELALSAWKAEILPLNEPRINLVDRKRIELLPETCKAPVLPLSLTAHY